MQDIFHPASAVEDEQLPQVSIITATFNAAATLRACLASVRQQSYRALEHIVIDGASTDETVDILRQNAGSQLRWLSEPDKGIYDAWNKGLRMATGSWIAFLGADDVLLPEAVDAYMQFAQQHPEAQYLSSQVRWVGPDQKVTTIGEAWSWPRFQRYMCTAHVASMHRRDLFETLGGFDTSLRIVADYELLLRAGPGLKSAFMHRETAQMQSGGASDSLAAIKEASRVKRTTGRRSRLASEAERIWAETAFRMRSRSMKRSI